MGAADKRQYERALKRALEMLSYRSRSHKEVAKDLEKREFEPEVIEEVLQQLHRYGYLDDLKLALNIIERCQEANKGWARIYSEMRRKGIDRETAEESLERHYDEDKAEDSLFFLVEESLSGFTDYPLESEVEAIARKLNRRGFPPSSTRNAVYRVVNDQR